MLILRRQLVTLSEADAAHFDDEVLANLRACYPEVVAQRGEEATRELIRFARERARVYGFTERAHVANYVGLAFLLGARFDSDGDLPWAGKILRDGTPLTSALRIERLVAVAIDYLTTRSEESNDA